ncbi:MAG: electron transfer flavoprotein subunit beta/FixA family protein [Eubacteriales bacterium]|nr:electron transfer flavoprotein subunit beta/FixA family protein [Eubacteriales bacterium]
MKIVVCIKQVPASNDARIDPETKRIVREGMKAILNPFDTYAIEEGVQLRGQFGGEVIALSMGPEKAAHSLREAISLGADRAILLSDRAFGGSDTWATSYALAKAIEKIGDVDLVICGKQAVDGDTAQVGPGIAAHLDWPQATYVLKVEEASREGIRVRRMNENGYDVCQMGYPAVLTVLKDINRPPVLTLKGALAALKVDIPVWKPQDIDADPAKIGLDPSPTRVVKTSPPPPRNTVTKVIQGAPADCARELVKDLRTRGIL